MASLIQKVGGIHAGALQPEFQLEVAKLLKRESRARQFPGAQPVSFAKRHIEELKREEYYVCEKTDGIRYLMYLTHDGTQDMNPSHWLIDRKNDYYWIKNLRFPHQEDKKKFHMDTLLDGELVEDRHPDGHTVIKFLVFDLLVIDGKDLRERTLDKRLAYLKEFVLRPLGKYLQENPRERANMAFSIEDKNTEFSYALDKMFNEIIPKVKTLHGNDGLIFTCKATPYVSGTDNHILKWKPPEENTVDFLMHIEWAQTNPEPDDPDQSLQYDYDAMPDITLAIYLGNQHDYQFVDTLHLEPEEWAYMKSLTRPLQDCIVECYQEETNGTESGRRWRFHRFRDDKSDANHITTYDSVIDSIRDHITQQDLQNCADDIRSAWKAREARRQPSRA